MLLTGRSQPKKNADGAALSSFHREIRAFVSAVARQDYDLLLLRARKGTGLFRLAMGGREPFWFKTVLSNRLHFFPAEQLIKARILLFDDALRGGEQVDREIERLVKLGVDRDRVHLAVFLVSDKAPQRLYPQYRHDKYFLLADDEYAKKTGELLELFIRGGVPLDVDHIEFKLSLSPADYPRFVEVVRSFASAHKAEIGERLPASLSSGGFINIIGTDFLQRDLFGLPAIFEEEGVVKARFYISPWVITFVPMGFFALPEAVTIDEIKSECNGSQLPLRFCETCQASSITSTLELLNESEFKCAAARLCLECAQFNFSLNMGKKFLSQFIHHARNNGVAFGGISLDLAHTWLLYPCLWPQVVSVVRTWLDSVRQKLGVANCRKC